MKKAKKLTQEQKLRQEVSVKELEIRELNGQVAYLSKRIDAFEKERDLNKELMNKNADIFVEKTGEIQSEVYRLMEIIKWQIKPESALQDNSKKSMPTGFDPFDNKLRRCC